MLGCGRSHEIFIENGGYKDTLIEADDIQYTVIKFVSAMRVL